MLSKGFIIRLLPFLGTFAIGLFIASFFVDIAKPTFKGKKCRKHHYEMKRLRVENEQLRNENHRLKSDLEAQAWPTREAPYILHNDPKGPGPEFPVEIAPPPPPAPRLVR